MIKVYCYSEDMEEFDPQVVADGMQQCFIRCGIRVMRDKEYGLFAVKDGKIIGATTHKIFYPPNAESMRFPVTLYDFDLAVMPEYQGGTVGYLLTQASIRYAQESECAGVDIRIINPLMTKLAKLCGFDVRVLSEEGERSYEARALYWI